MDAVGRLREAQHLELDPLEGNEQPGKGQRAASKTCHLSPHSLPCGRMREKCHE